MSRVPIERFRQTRQRPRCGLGTCVDALDLDPRGRAVVLKFLPPLHGEEEFLHVEEVARSLEPLRHAAIVPTLGHGIDGATPFFVIAPPEGRSLTELLVEHNDGARWPDLALVRSIVDGACAATAIAHRMRVVTDRPVIHGLLSSHSVFVQHAAGDAWEVAVMDFALASLQGVAWRAAHDDLAGDPRPPEQLADPTALSCAGDVFALGVLAVTLLVPFTFPMKPVSWARFVERHWADGRALLQSMRPDLPPGLCDELMKALAPTPEDRHPDADRLRMALRRVAWQPVRELPPAPCPLRSPPAGRVQEASSPQIRLPPALVAEPERASRFLAPAVSAPSQDASGWESTEFVAPVFTEHTVPTPSAIEALHSLRRAERLGAKKEPSPREETVVTAAPVQAPRWAPGSPARDDTVACHTPSCHEGTQAIPLPEGDLFTEIPWHPSVPPATNKAPTFGDGSHPNDSTREILSERSFPKDSIEETLAEGSNHPAERTLSEAWEGDETVPTSPIERTRVGRLPSPEPSPKRPATLAPPWSPPTTAVPPTPSATAFPMETTLEINAPPTWCEPSIASSTQVSSVPPPAHLPSSRSLLIAAGVTATLLTVLALWWSLR